MVCWLAIATAPGATSALGVARRGTASFASRPLMYACPGAKPIMSTRYSPAAWTRATAATSSFTWLPPPTTPTARARAPAPAAPPPPPGPLDVGRELALVAPRPLPRSRRRLFGRGLLLHAFLHQDRRRLEGVAVHVGMVRVVVQREAAERRHHVAHPRPRARMHRGRELLHELVHLEVKLVGKLDVSGAVVERHDRLGLDRLSSHSFTKPSARQRRSSNPG